MILAGCTDATIVCDDHGTVTDWRFVVLEVLAGTALLLLAVLLLLTVLRRRAPRQLPSRRVWISADGVVLRSEDGPGASSR